MIYLLMKFAIEILTLQNEGKNIKWGNIFSDACSNAKQINNFLPNSLKNTAELWFTDHYFGIDSPVN